jgi:ABC-type transporter Mla subunit MlaD
MKKDRLIGMITIAAVLLLIIYVAFAMWLNERRAQNTVLVQFNEMGALQKEDVVVIRGLEIGYVASVTRANEKALVEIDLYEPRIFRKDSKFKNISPNIMGSRIISIEPGKNGEVAPEGYVFDGDFEWGLAEILALSNIAKQQVAVLMEFIRLLQTGDEKNPSLQKQVENIIIECEDLVSALSKTLNSVENQTMGVLNRVNGYASDIQSASIKVNNILDTIVVQAQDGIITAGDLILKVNNSIEGLNDILIRFENSPVTVALLDKKDIINDLDSLMFSLQAFISSIDRKGIKVYDENGKRKSMVSLKNIHILRETARSKAKKRAAQEDKTSLP